MIPVLSRWLVANYTSVKSFAFWKVSVKVYNFRVLVYKEVPLPWIKWNLSFNDDCLPTILGWKVSFSKKWVLIYATLGFPFINRFPSHEWNDTHLWNTTHPLTMIAGQVYEWEFSFSKKWVSINFRLSVYKGVALPCMKWYPSFNADWWLSILFWKVLPSEKQVLNYRTLGFPFIKGFPSMNEMKAVL